jgi:hypothetical protein
MNSLFDSVWELGMFRSRSGAIRLLIAAWFVTAAPSGASAHIDTDAAERVFNEAQAMCARDRGMLWGRSVCGPTLLVDPGDRTAIANQPDAERKLHAEGNVFVGRYAEPAVISNTPTQWAGRRWTLLMWPIHTVSDFFPPISPNRWTRLMRGEPDQSGKLRVTIAHELFHRIQPDLGLTRPDQGNRHLDSLEGRYWLQLEWRALAEALAAPSAKLRRQAVADALLFRSERYRRCPGADQEERALEVDEGVPEYTGVKLAFSTRPERVRYAIYDLALFVQSPTFVRSFAYATGPAYGLLLDLVDPRWRGELRQGASQDELLRRAMRVPPGDRRQAEARQSLYGGSSLRKTELDREAARQLRIRALKAALVDGPVLMLSLEHANYQFNPQTVQALGTIGNVYPTMHVEGNWGVLQVEAGGALVDSGMTRLMVSAAGMQATSPITGHGWSLTLNPGWRVAPGDRKGDFVVIPVGSSGPARGR